MERSKTRNRETLKNKSPKEFAEELIEMHTLYLGDDGALNEFWTDKLDAIRHASITLREIYQLGAKNNLREPLTYLNATETELNKILKQL